VISIMSDLENFDYLLQLFYLNGHIFFLFNRNLLDLIMF